MIIYNILWPKRPGTALFRFCSMNTTSVYFAVENTGFIFEPQAHTVHQALGVLLGYVFAGPI
jgi:hypothetical protein